MLNFILLLVNIDGLRIITKYDDNFRSAFWLYTIFVERKYDFIEYMKEKGVTCSQVHQRNDIHSCFREFQGKLGLLDDFERGMVCLPVGWWLEVDDICKICNWIKEFFE